MTETTEQTIAIAATFTAELIEEPLVYWMQELGIPSKIEFAPYNQVFQELLNPSSLLLKNNDGINTVLIRPEDWHKSGDNLITNAAFTAQEKKEIERNIQDFIEALKSAAERFGLLWIVCICPASSIITEDKDSVEFFRMTEARIVSELSSIRGVYLVTASDLNTLYPVSKYDDPFSDKIGHIPFTPEFFTSLATMIARRIFAIRSKPYKVIVLDCDQTLWKGICGEDGVDGVEIDAPHRKLQEFMIDQNKTGMLLCLCSKNNEEDVGQVFERHPGMCLRTDHIVSRRINWKSKPENIKSLAEELKLGLDSFIFIDDDPIECARVQAECPDVLTGRLPQEPNDIPRFLNHVWAFDHLEVTAEDKKRTRFYKQQVERNRFQEKSITFGDFLEGLQLNVCISKMSDSQISRVAQLTQRTNQFNFTTIRRSETDIQKVYQSKELECYVVEVSDRFGDYGLVGVMIFRPNDKALEVDTFLLSCRVLGRGVEHQMMRELGRIAIERGKSHVDVRYIPTERNKPAHDFLNRIYSESTQPLGDGFLNRCPVKFAELLIYEPVLAESGLPEQSGSAASDTNNIPNVQYKSALLSRNAMEFYNAEQILEKIRERKLESQGSQDLCRRLEQVLRKHAAVRQVAVRFRDDTYDRKRLIAYVVADPKNSPVISGHSRYLLPNNMAIVHQNKIETDIRYKEIFTDQIYLKHGIVINEGDCIFDVGANIGMFTLFIQQVCKNTRIYAFEPVPQLYEMLRINTALYAPSAELFNCGLSDENKKMTITFYPHATGRSSYYPEMENNDSARRFFLEQQAQQLIEEDMPNRYIDEMLERASITETFTTQLTTLSDILVQNEIDRINLLKIDVERSELDVLFGINKQDWRRIDQIVMEVHSEILLDKVMSVLKSNYYHIVVDQPALYKDFEHFMLYAIQEQAQGPSLSGKEVKLTCDRPLTTPSTHLLSGKELRDFLKSKMPRLTMPLDVMFLDALPRYTSGELNNQALPVPDRTNCNLDRSSAEPLTFVQSTLCRIWEEVLVIDKVDLYDNFFDIGGQSLLGTVVMSHIQTTFQVELPLLSIFKSPTVAELAQLIEQHLIDQLDPTELNEELEELKRLSDEEVKELLAHKNTLLAENDSEVSS